MKKERPTEPAAKLASDEPGNSATAIPTPAVERLSKDHAENIVASVPVPLLLLDGDLRVRTASRVFCNYFHVTLEEAKGRIVYDLGNRQWDIPALRTLLEEILPRESEIADYEVRHTFEQLGQRIMRLDAHCLMQPSCDETLIILSIEDITERTREEEVCSRLAAIVENSDDAIIGKDLTGIITNWNTGAEKLFGYAVDEIVGQAVTILIPPERHHEEADILSRIGRGERIARFETVRQCKDGCLIDVAITISPIMDATGNVIGASKIARDITAQKKDMAALAQSHALLQTHVEELMRFNQVAIRRELRMIDLKKEVNALSERLGEPARYPLDFEEKGHRV